MFIVTKLDLWKINKNWSELNWTQENADRWTRCVSERWLTHRCERLVRRSQPRILCYRSLILFRTISFRNDTAYTYVGGTAELIYAAEW